MAVKVNKAAKVRDAVDEHGQAVREVVLDVEIVGRDVTNPEGRYMPTLRADAAGVMLDKLATMDLKDKHAFVNASVPGFSYRRDLLSELWVEVRAQLQTLRDDGQI